MSDLPVVKKSFWAILFDPIKKAFAKPVEKPERPAHGADWDRSQGAKNPYPAGVSMAAFSQHGYVFAAVSRASQDLAALPIKLIKGKGKSSEILEEHPFLDLMDQPSTYVDGFAFREQLIVDLMLTGGCYCLLAGQTEIPTSLFRLHPEQTKIITDVMVGIKGFEFSDSGNIVEYPIERVVYSQSASWGTGVDALYGVGGIQPLQKEIGADIAAQRLASDSAKKGRPDILISPSDEADIWDYEQRRSILDAYKGMSTQGGAMVLSGQVKIEPLQISPRDLEFQKVRDYTRQAISAVFGVPPSVLGDNSANFAVSRQQAQNYWEVQTKRGKRLSFLLTQIAKRFDPSLRVEIDYSGVEALQEIRNSQLDRITKHILNGMSASDAYDYEGMSDSPVVAPDKRESEAEDLGDEEGQNVRGLVALLKTVTKEKVDYGAKSNAKEAMEALPEATQTGLKKKAAEHNEEFGKDPEKKLTNRNYLAVSYHRGMGAFQTNPSSVRPTVSTGQQWAMARVNGLLYALRNGKYKRKPFDTDLLPPDHPLKNDEEKIIKDVVTNFPSRGKDKEVSLSNSEYKVFDVEYALDLKKRYPEIWGKGGNIEGNNQFRRLYPIAKRADKTPQTDTEEMAIRKREAWSARHLKDFRLAGTVAQIKWLTVGERGEKYMKQLIEEEKQKINESKKQKQRWMEYIEKKQGPAEKSLEIAVYGFLRGSLKRYQKRIRTYISAQKQNGSPQVTKAVIDWKELLGLADEVSIAQSLMRKKWVGIWSLSGNQAMQDVFKQAGIDLPENMVFGDRKAAVDAADLAAYNITQTTANKIKKAIENGLLAGKGPRDLAKDIEEDTSFSAARSLTIARTESNKAINMASVQAYQTSANNGINVQKGWISSRDDRVRDTHLEIDGQLQDVNDDFVIPSTGDTATAPGDFGVEEQDINCRCSVFPKVLK